MSAEAWFSFGFFAFSFGFFAGRVAMHVAGWLERRSR